MTEIDERPIEVDDDPNEPFRPTRPRQQGRPPTLLGRLVRWVIGVHEHILAWVPEERPRYTRLGAIVFCTGLMATVSMETALTKMTSINGWLLLPIAIFWGLLILCLDSWMISSTHGVLGAARYRMLIPRLLISIVIGAVIAEPLVLLIFQPSIDQRIEQTQNDAITAVRTAYANCYKPQDPSAPRQCPKSLNLSGSPDSIQTQLDNKKRDRATLASDITTIQGNLDQKIQLAANECAGVSGSGLSGQAGIGNRCNRDRQEVDTYRAQTHIDEKNQNLIAIDADIAKLTDDLQSAQANWDSTVATAIDQEVAKVKEEQSHVGLLDEDRALGELAQSSFIVFMSQWLVRILLILIDALPVLTKMLGGITHYDRIVYRQLNTSDRLHNRWIRIREQEDGTVREFRLEHADDRSRETRRRRHDKLYDDIDKGTQGTLARQRRYDGS